MCVGEKIKPSSLQKLDMASSWRPHIQPEMLWMSCHAQCQACLTQCPTLGPWSKWPGGASADTCQLLLWTKNKSISRKQNPGPLSPSCSQGRINEGGIVTQGSSLSLTNFILWAMLASHWPQSLPQCNQPHSCYWLSPTALPWLPVAVWETVFNFRCKGYGLAGKIVFTARSLANLCEEKVAHQNRWASIFSLSFGSIPAFRLMWTGF